MRRKPICFAMGMKARCNHLCVLVCECWPFYLQVSSSTASIHWEGRLVSCRAAVCWYVRLTFREGVMDGSGIGHLMPAIQQAGCLSRRVIALFSYSSTPLKLVESQQFRESNVHLPSGVASFHPSVSNLTLQRNQSRRFES
jgi:hypothetical protein